MNDSNGTPAIAELLRLCRPSTVAAPVLRRAFLAMSAGIVAVVILSIKRTSCGPWPQITKKGLVGSSPPIADLNSPTTIIRIASRTVVIAPCLHGVPRQVFSLNPPDARGIVRGESLNGFFPLETSAAFGKTVGQIPVYHNRLAPALTTASPSLFALAFICDDRSQWSIDHGQPAKCVPDLNLHTHASL